MSARGVVARCVLVAAWSGVCLVVLNYADPSATPLWARYLSCVVGTVLGVGLGKLLTWAFNEVYK